jgi:hypothetical protein
MAVRSSWPHSGLIMMALLILCYAAIGYLTWPLGRDQGILSWVGEVILDGGVPYKDAWDIKGPLAYYGYALALGILGRHEVAIRSFDLIVVLACCVLLRRLVFRLGVRQAIGANYAVIVFLLTYFALGFWHTAQPDGWAGMLVLVVVTLLIESPGRPLWVMTGIGVVIALATLIKPTFSMFLVLPLLYPVRKVGESASNIGSLSCCVLGFGAASSAVLAAIFHDRAAFQDVTDVAHFLRSTYSPFGQRHVLSELGELPLILAVLGLLSPFVLSIVGIFAIRKDGRRRQSGILAAWFTLAFLEVAVQGRYWAYHWIPVMVAMAPILGATFDIYSRRLTMAELPQRKSGALIVLICCCVLAPSGELALYSSYGWPSYLFGLENRRQYVAKFWDDLGSFDRVSEYIQQHSSSTDGVLMWGYDPLINVLSERKSPSRFSMSYCLVVDGPLRVKFRNTFMQDIGRTPPYYIVVDAGTWALVDKSGKELLSQFPQFDRYLHDNYVLARWVGTFEVWKRASS